jgi:phosphoserine phosphatase RsbU/P
VIDNGDLSPDKFNQTLLDHLNLIIKGKPIDDITLLTLRIF